MENTIWNNALIHDTVINSYNRECINMMNNFCKERGADIKIKDFDDIIYKNIVTTAMEAVKKYEIDMTELSGRKMDLKDIISYIDKEAINKFCDKYKVNMDYNETPNFAIRGRLERLAEKAKSFSINFAAIFDKKATIHNIEEKIDMAIFQKACSKKGLIPDFNSFFMDATYNLKGVEVYMDKFQTALDFAEKHNTDLTPLKEEKVSLDRLVEYITSEPLERFCRENGAEIKFQGDNWFDTIQSETALNTDLANIKAAFEIAGKYGINMKEREGEKLCITGSDLLSEVSKKAVNIIKNEYQADFNIKSLGLNPTKLLPEVEELFAKAKEANMSFDTLKGKTVTLKELNEFVENGMWLDSLTKDSSKAALEPGKKISTLDSLISAAGADTMQPKAIVKAAVNKEER